MIFIEKPWGYENNFITYNRKHIGYLIYNKI